MNLNPETEQNPMSADPFRTPAQEPESAAPETPAAPDEPGVPAGQRIDSANAAPSPLPNNGYYPQNPAGYPAPPPMPNGYYPQNPAGYPAPPPMPSGYYPQNPAGYPAPPPMPSGYYPQNPAGYPAPPPMPNGFQPDPAAPGGFPYPFPPAPAPLDPRYQQYQTSTLQPGQREILNCTNVTKIYGSTQALTNLSLKIGSGRVVGLLGPNGSGKTTLIKLVCGLLTPTTGTITVNGEPIGPRTKAMVSYLPDRTYIPEWMKIRQILDYFCDFYADFRRPLAEAMLGNLRISPDAVMKTLSKGTQEKVQLILVMSRNASLYLLDEPIAGVDPVARDYILDTIIRTHNPDSSVIISTHLITDIEPALNEVVMIKYGTLALQGEVNELRNTFGKSLNDIFKEVFAGC